MILSVNTLSHLVHAAVAPGGRMESCGTATNPTTRQLLSASLSAIRLQGVVGSKPTLVKALRGPTIPRGSAASTRRDTLGMDSSPAEAPKRIVTPKPIPLQPPPNPG